MTIPEKIERFFADRLNRHADFYEIVMGIRQHDEKMGRRPASLAGIAGAVFEMTTDGVLFEVHDKCRVCLKMAVNYPVETD